MTPFFYDPPIILQQAAQKLQTLDACTKFYEKVGSLQRPAGGGRRRGGEPCLPPVRRVAMHCRGESAWGVPGVTP